MKPTKEQERIFHFIKNRPENILIEAYAGTGKTSTIVHASRLIDKSKKIVFLAFNRHIKEELKEKLPENIKCYTTYGLGYSAVMRKYPDIKFDEYKVDKIIQKKSKSWNLDKDFSDYEEKQFYLKQLKKLVNHCRLTVTLDKKYIPYLSDRHDLGLNKPEDIKRTLKILDVLTTDRKTMDFIDMIFLPAIDRGIWMFQYDYVLVDECLPHNTYISTEIGKKQIGTLFLEYMKGKILPNIITYNEESKLFENKKIKNIWCTGEKDVHYVMLNGKRKLKSTVNHKFLTSDGWKRLDELKLNDIILSNYSEQPYHQILNETQKNIVIGSMFGDGHLGEISKNIYRLRVIHGEKQKEYCEWKAMLMNSKTNKITNNGFANKIGYNFLSKTFYLNKENIYEDITLQSLAISWMDDGSMNNENYLSSRLYSTAKCLNNSKKLSETLYKKWGIESTIKKGKSSSTKKIYYWLQFNKTNTEKISKLLREYIHPTMDYKLCPNDRDLFNKELWISNKSELGCMIVTKTHSFYKREKTYDMEVEDNHNFIVTSRSMVKCKAENYGIITHNCQDFNRAQIKIVEKILKRDRKFGTVLGRLISVGDKNQSIYGFNSSDDKSFEWFRNFQNTKVLPLSKSFRCGKNIIEVAQKLVPEITALDDAPDGIVRSGSVLTEAQSGDLVLCRTTIPLIRLFFHFLLKKKKAFIRGSDIGENMIELIGDIKTIDELIKHWEHELENKRNNLYKLGVLNPSEDAGFSNLEDKVSTLLFLARVSKNIIDLINNINRIFSDDKNAEGIILSTIHKAKGSESNKVIIVRKDLLPMANARGWQYGQELNLEYIAYTRAKSELIIDYDWSDEEEN